MGKSLCDDVDAPIVIEQFLYELTHSPGIAVKDSQCLKLSHSNLLLETEPKTIPQKETTYSQKAPLVKLLKSMDL